MNSMLALFMKHLGYSSKIMSLLWVTDTVKAIETLNTNFQSHLRFSNLSRQALKFSTSTEEQQCFLHNTSIPFIPILQAILLKEIAITTTNNSYDKKKQTDVIITFTFTTLKINKSLSFSLLFSQQKQSTDKTNKKVTSRYRCWEYLLVGLVYLSQSKTSNASKLR